MMGLTPQSTGWVDPGPTVYGASAGAATFWVKVRSHGRGLAWVLGGKLALVGGNAVLMLILANLLSLSVYGLFVVAIGAQLLLSRGLMLGMDAGMVRLRTLPDLVQQAPEIVRAGLVAMAYTSGTLSLGALTVALVWSWPAMPGWLVATVVGGAVGTALLDYGYCFRLAELEYRAAALLQGGTAMARAALTLLTAVLLGGHASAVFMAYAGVSLFSGLAITVTVARHTSGRPAQVLLRRLLRYSIWLGVANIVVVLSLYEGTFLLLRIGQPAAAGVFGLGLTLSLAFFALYNAFYEYIFPRIVRLASIHELRRFLARSCGAALALSLSCAPVIVVTAVVTPHLVPAEFAGVVTVFFFLAASMLVLVLQAPFEAACQALLRPHLVLLSWVLRVTAIGLLAWLWTSEGGAVGAALAQLSGSALAAAALSALVMREIRASRWRAGGGDIACAG